MTQQLYKAVFKRRPAKRGWRNHFTDWLEANGRLDHLVNIYSNDGPIRYEMVVVLSDRNTALMLKLALG